MNKPLLYIHIPKTAGVSIQNSGLVKKSHWEKDFINFKFDKNSYKK